MNRVRVRLLIGLVVAVALAWGATLDLTAAKAAAKATAKAVATATAAAKAPATPAKTTTPARTAAKAPDAAVREPLPATPLGTAAQGQGQGQGQAKGKATRDEVAGKFQKVPPSELKAAAKRAAAMGMKPGVAGLGDIGIAAATPLPDIGETRQGPGGVPHYFGPYANMAFSPLPKGTLNRAVRVDSGGSGYSDNPTITITDAYDPTLLSTAQATVVDGEITAIAVITGGIGYTAPVVSIEDSTGTDAAATATFNLRTLTGGMRKFVDKLPGLGPRQQNELGQYLPVAVPTPWPLGCAGTGCTADYYEIALVEYAELMHSDLPTPTRLRGYVQIVPPGWTGTDALGNLYNAVALTTANGLVQNVTINGAQAYGASKPHYLGPIIVAKGKVHGIQVAGPDAGDPVPVRVKYYNLLPASDGAVPVGTGLRPGDLFIPVDETIPGAGVGPATGATTGKYSQNRMTPHLHGNNTVWLSDGNTHQWITPPNETTPYPAGVSARNVPDMSGCAEDETNAPLLPGRSGCMTFYYTNAQSARLQFYHDHAHGITRLNVYAGVAAGYVLTDAVEQDMALGTNATGVNPDGLQVLPPDNGGLGIPLVIQDKTFVQADTIFAQDPTWNWGTGPRDADGYITEAVTGDLWYPHVYMTVQNPWDLTGTNGVGKWHYGPWFNPPVPTCPGDGSGEPGCIEVGPVPNPYYQPDCDMTPPGAGCTTPWEPPFMPGAPNPSSPGESFFDAQLVNGTAYPYLEVEPRAYRFRILNASNDRFLNLQLYRAFDKANFDFGTGVAHPPTATTDCLSPLSCTEVKMVPITVNPANQFADTPSGIPDPLTAGPPWWLIGTEGGFMPKPLVVPQQPVGWNLDMGYFAFGIVNQHSIFLGAAERADVIVDFSQYAPGTTLILYNDSPAPVPAGAGVFDFYTGNGNQMDAGGAPNTLPGYGPNTRTIMQIRVTAPPVTEPPTPIADTSEVTLANLTAVFAKTAGKRGVFEVSQDTIIVPQEAYNSAYDASFPTSAAAQFLQIDATAKTFTPIGGTEAVTIPLEMKAMHDEMGGVYDIMYGRMSGMLGLVNPNSNVHLLIPYPYASPPTDVVKGTFEATPIGSLADGTQIWRIFHNGVDTHPIHTHLFHTQIVNRVDQSGQIVGDPVDPTELGWKDTVRINPLEVTFLALKPTVPAPTEVPFEVPDSIRLIDPALPEGATLPPPAPAGWFDPTGFQLEGADTPVNHFVNFGWEYVWHCHILSHEEMDMMHSLVFAVPPRPPTGLVAAWNGATGGNRRVTLNWTDNSIKEAGFTVQRATDANFTVGLTSFDVAARVGSGLLVTYVDSSIANNTRYWYRVFAIGPVVGDTATPNFPTMSADSVSDAVSVLVGTAPGAPAAPTTLAATVQTGPQVSLTWRDNATNETGFVIERCTGVGCTNFVQIATAGPRNNTGAVTFVDNTVAFGNDYAYRVAASNSTGLSAAYSNTASVTVSAIAAAPTGVLVVNTPRNGPNSTMTLSWNSTGASGFTIQRAITLDFGAGETGPAAAGLQTFTVAGTALSYTDTVRDNTTYYYRIRANNSVGGFSAWVNAQPFPIRSGQ